MTLNDLQSVTERAVVEEEYSSRNAEGYLRAYIKFARQMLSFSCYLRLPLHMVMKAQHKNMAKKQWELCAC